MQYIELIGFVQFKWQNQYVTLLDPGDMTFLYILGQYPRD